MAKKSKAKNEEECPLCHKRANSVTTFADGSFIAVHGYKWVELIGEQGGKIPCQVPVLVHTEKSLIEEDF